MIMKKISLILFILFNFFVYIPPGKTQRPEALRRLVVEKIEITGNSKTKPEVIYRYLTIRPGQSITPSIIESNYQRLSQTNFFKEVDFYTRPGSEKGKVVVVIEVKERHWPYFQFEGGHSDLNGWYFVPASLRFDNIFGKGNFIGIRLFVGDRISKLAIGYMNPGLFDGNAFLDIELASGEQEFIHYFGSTRTTQNVSFGGLQLKLGGNRGFFKHLYFGYRTESFEPDEFVKVTGKDSTIFDLPTGIARNLNKTQIASFSLVLHEDSRDNIYYPLRGFWGALAWEFVHKELGSDINFSRITLDARAYKKLWGRQVFAVHLKSGYSNQKAPFYERFYLGGANSLRGYPDRRLTPVGWGTKLILTNTEFRFPLSQKNFPRHGATGILFFDAGGIWLPGQNPDLSDFFTSLGFGFRIKFPIVGTTRFDFSFPLNRIDENDFQFHISLGQTF